MKKLAFVGTACLTALIIFAFTYRQKQIVTNNPAAYRIMNTISCAPDRSKLFALLDNTDIPPMPGAGSYHWKISTKNDSAQFYFNQGINMYYGFHIIEALASFKKAARLDPDNPMVWWAQALALGPNINDVGYSASPEALDVTKKALALINKATPSEKALINAMNVRYSADSTQTREKLNQDYVEAMKKAYEKYPAVPDVITLYADALMLQHPWDLWYPNGTPKKWTPLIQKTLETALAKAPLHPGANHYYIHVVEASPYANKALPSADRLGKLTPGLAHMVHMPSHIYLRTGQFNKGTEINETAIQKFSEYASLFPAVQEAAFLYLWHNQHMKANCAMLAGRYDLAFKSALELQQSIDTSFLSLPAPMGALVQYIYSTPLLMNIRFEKWDVLVDMPKPAAHHVYANILYHFGRGMALAAKNEIEAAKKEAEQLKTLMENKDLTIPFKPFSAAIEGAHTADGILNGFIALKQNQTETVLMHFLKAAQTEERMVYNEPRDWLLNPKQYLGSAYLAAKQYSKAETAFKNDLKVNAQNIWSLNGLHKTYLQSKKKVEAASIKKQLDKAAQKADVDFKALIF